MLIRDWLPSGVKGTARVLIEVIEKKLSLMAHAVVGVTPALTARFQNRNKISAYNFITSDFFEEALRVSRPPAAREFDLVHLGTLNQRRGVFLAGLLTRFHERRPQGKSLIIGAPPEVTAALKPLLPGNCVIMGGVPHKEIPGLLGNSKIGLDVHPWAGTHLNVAFPVKIAEYMASECAVVCSSMPVLDTILEKAGTGPGAVRVISGGVPQDYADAAVSLLEDIDSGGHPGSVLRTVALRHMLWDHEAVKIADLYLRLLAAPPG
jgi:glycosyltransferase involved in cell wall biosynthesis